MSEGDRQMRPMTRQQALGKLASTGYGRVMFTQHAMPAIRPVNHLLHDGHIIIRCHDDSAITARADPGAEAPWSTRPTTSIPGRAPAGA